MNKASRKIVSRVDIADGELSSLDFGPLTTVAMSRTAIFKN